ncbi:excinuclease ABC subunit A [Defluviimonas aestuarii]|uniref:excinuclease ABC subunit A n=1 Tax=Albidovulum aestuarii TaxID=1130726 RepID=UPI00249AB531|nr:excinuclease ABC subunit A [Defluviimonas aestuarii]MDI3335950.1 excinuclease ABC subunit A [Defluviimonas aestuarii]
MKSVLVFAALSLGALALPAHAGNGHCPPGLAKKSPACIPPGQAKKHYGAPRIGNRVSDYDYHLIRYPDRYNLPPLRRGERYYVIDGQILRVNQETREILDFIRATAALLD